MIAANKMEDKAHPDPESFPYAKDEYIPLAGEETDPDDPEQMIDYRSNKAEAEAGEDWDEAGYDAKYGGSRVDKHGQLNDDFEPQAGNCGNCGHPYDNHSTVDNICYGGGDGKLGEGPLGGCPCGISYPFVRKDWNEGNR